MSGSDSCAFCPFCGEKLSGEFKFCPKCGKPIPVVARNANALAESVDKRTKEQRERDHRKWVHLRRLARKRRQLREEKKLGIRRETMLEYVVRCKLKLCFAGFLHFTDPGLMHQAMPKRFRVLSYLYCILAWCVILFSFVAPIWCGIFEPNAKFTPGEWIVIPLASLVVGLLVGAKRAAATGSAKLLMVAYDEDDDFYTALIAVSLPKAGFFEVIPVYVDKFGGVYLGKSELDEIEL